MDNTRTVKAGIIGCGGIANGKHLPALKNLPDVSVVAFCDIIKERAEEAAKRFAQRVQGYTPTTASCLPTRRSKRFTSARRTGLTAL